MHAQAYNNNNTIKNCSVMLEINNKRMNENSYRPNSFLCKAHFLCKIKFKIRTYSCSLRFFFLPLLLIVAHSLIRDVEVGTPCLKGCLPLE